MNLKLLPEAWWDQENTSEIELRLRTLDNKDFDAIPFLNNEISVIKMEFQYFQISIDGSKCQCLCFLFRYYLNIKVSLVN